MPRSGRLWHGCASGPADLVRNNPYATKAVEAMVSNLVGTGIMPRTRASRQRLVKAADALW
jgi:hypothetical protein